MKSSPVLIVQLVLALAVIASMTACSQPHAEPTTIQLTVVAEAPATPRTEAVSLGSEVTLEIHSEVSDELHVHGYEVATQLEPGANETLQFTADMAGAFEVETHSNPAVWIKLVVA